MAEDGPQHAITPRAEQALSRIVLAGAVISAVLFAAGLVTALASSSITDASQKMSLDSIVASIASMDSMGLIGLGMLIVIATPLVRVLATILYFSQRDRRLVLLPIITFALIVAGFILRMLG